MPNPPVVNASPLIILAKAGFLDLLHLAGATVVVPLTVAAEVRRAGPGDPAVQALGNTPWLTFADTGTPHPALFPFGLDPGEESVLTWALNHTGTEALIDDGFARRCASALGVPHRGCLGLVLAAKTQGVIPAARPVVEQLRAVGLRLSAGAMSAGLAVVGE